MLFRSWGSILYTAINIPYGSMASAITDNPRQRAELSTFRSMGATFASVVIMMVAPVVVYYKDENGNQIVSPTNFTLIAGAFGVLAVICYILCYQLTRERVKIEKVNGGKMPGLGETFYALFSNRALLAIIGAAIFLLLSSLMGQSMNNYLFAEWFKNTGALSVMGFVGVPTSLILAVFTGKITDRKSVCRERVY